MARVDISDYPGGEPYGYVDEQGFHLYPMTPLRRQALMQTACANLFLIAVCLIGGLGTAAFLVLNQIGLLDRMIGH